MDEMAEGAGIESAAPEDGPAPTFQAERYVSRSCHFFKKNCHSVITNTHK